MENDTLAQRLGNFFILMGLLLLVLFVLSHTAQSPQIWYLLGSIGAIVFGYRLYRKAPQPPPSERFSLIRRSRQKARQRREQRQQGKQ